jgi:hypothetical protein
MWERQGDEMRRRRERKKKKRKKERGEKHKALKLTDSTWILPKAWMGCLGVLVLKHYCSWEDRQMANLALPICQGRFE